MLFHLSKQPLASSLRPLAQAARSLSRISSAGWVSEVFFSESFVEV